MTTAEQPQVVIAETAHTATKLAEAGWTMLWTRRGVYAMEAPR